ncbi:uncharacterized protein LOC141649312 [Silene latifolia]|uniref:uncharacterized protein LOC141649312 n=1 Tax=Silene latifolia TaxID=37657 RepID=UPI003D788FFC
MYYKGGGSDGVVAARLEALTDQIAELKTSKSLGNKKTFHAMVQQKESCARCDMNGHGAAECLSTIEQVNAFQSFRQGMLDIDNNSNPSIQVDTVDVELETVSKEVDAQLQSVAVLKEGLVLSENPNDWVEVSGQKQGVVTQPARLEPIDENETAVIESRRPVLKLTEDDVKDEIAYWKQAVYGYVMGANPPWDVLDGFLRRIWFAYEISKISFLPNGLFVVRFAKPEHHKLVLANGMFLFDGKPIVIKLWDPSVRISKVSVKKVPIWVKLVGLDLKFWGAKCLEKLASLVGRFVRIDDSTLDKALLGFARIMVEVEIDQSFPNSITFEDELGNEVKVAIEYDWITITCKQCRGIGHATNACRRKVIGEKRPLAKQPQRQVWQPKGASGKDTTHVDPKEFPPLVSHEKQLVLPPSTSGLVTPVVVPGPIYTPARVITRMTRHESRTVGGQGTVFSVNYQAEMAKATGTAEMVEKGGGGEEYVTNTGCHPGGRIWVLWNSGTLEVDVLEIDPQYIHIKVKERITGSEFIATYVYAFNKLEDRASLWNNLVRICVAGPWVVLGDFNNVMYANERLGKAVKDDEMLPFQNTVASCDLHDLHTTGAFFTWNNKQPSETRVFSRIDRVLVNGAWLTNCSDWFAHFQPEGSFDHCPCIISCGGICSVNKKPFKFFNMWTKVDEFKTVVQQGWDILVVGTPMYQVVRKLKLLKPALKSLNSELFSDIERNADVAFKLLTECQVQLQQDCTNISLIDQEKQLRESYMLLAGAREDFLKQKAKCDWARDGDSNCEMFHQAIRQRHLHNKVLQIENSRGVQCNDPGDILQAFVDYYQELLGSNAQTSDFYQHIVTHGELVEVSDWDRMCRIPSEEDVRRVLFSIPDDKSPGPDGYTSCFFKASWSVIKEDVCAAVKDFFVHGKLLTQIISPTQSAFIKGRSILGNILISQDLVRLYTRKTISPRCLMKVDLRKAYDSIEWIFVEQMMKALNFPPKLIGLVMQCVTSTSYSIALNGQLHGFFHGKRGLRQGDPMSPLLFTMCMEYLSRLLKTVSQMQGFHFHPLCKALKLTHLMFADDLLIFCKGETRTVFIVMEAFKRFSNASGLNINSEKSDFYCNGMSPAIVQKVLHGTGFKKGELPFKYLGVKISHKRLSKIDCNILVDRMINRIRGWNSRKISYSGRLVLVKSILATIHNHWAQIFVLPVGVMERIHALCRNFLWEGEDKYSKAPLVAWNVLCQSKEYGGLGIIDSKLWNIAAIGKLVWWLASKQDHLWIKWVNNIYIKGASWWQYEPTNYSSWAWRKICAVKNTMQAGYVQGKWRGIDEPYTIADGYKWLLQVPAEKVTWYKVVWNRYNLPKWSFIMWLRQHHRLLTLDRLRNMGMDVPSLCFICGLDAENHDHLFTHCWFAKKCYHLAADWLQVSVDVLSSCGNILKYRCSMFIRQVCMSAVVGISYGIWRCRNLCRLEGYVTHPSKLIAQVQQDCKRRVSEINKSQQGTPFSNFYNKRTKEHPFLHRSSQNVQNPQPQQPQKNKYVVPQNRGNQLQGGYERQNQGGQQFMNQHQQFIQQMQPPQETPNNDMSEIKAMLQHQMMASQKQEALITQLMAHNIILDNQIAQLSSQKSSRQPGALPSQPDKPHDTANAIHLQSGLIYDGLEMPLVIENVIIEELDVDEEEKSADEAVIYRAADPLPMVDGSSSTADKTTISDKGKIKDVEPPIVIKVPSDAKFMKDILTRKRNFNEVENIAFTEECSAHLQIKQVPTQIEGAGLRENEHRTS